MTTQPKVSEQAMIDIEQELLRLTLPDTYGGSLPKALAKVKEVVAQAREEGYQAGLATVIEMERLRQRIINGAPRRSRG